MSWAAEAAPHASLWAQYWAILTDPAHVLNEITLALVVDLLFFRVISGSIRKRFRQRDSEHGHDHDQV
jgi:hypothetical protein